MKKLIVNKEKGEITCPFCGELEKTLDYEQVGDVVQGSYDIKNQEWIWKDQISDESTTKYFCPDCEYEFKYDEITQIL